VPEWSADVSLWSRQVSFASNVSKRRNIDLPEREAKRGDVSSVQDIPQLLHATCLALDGNHTASTDSVENDPIAQSRHTQAFAALARHPKSCTEHDLRHGEQKGELCSEA
jgi:hypothetical protein